MTSKKVEEVTEGIYLDPVPITLGAELKIKYKGVLTNTEVSRIFLHAGYGHGDWQKIIDIPMKKTRDGGYTVTLEIEEPTVFNFCFRDDAENWDNNMGKNWSYQVHNGIPITAAQP